MRPEDLHPAGAGADPATVLPARVDLVELLGGEALVHVTSGGTELTARTPSAVPAAGREVRLVVPPQRVHLFDAPTGERITREGEAA